MPRPYSEDMRQRVIGRVEDGTSRRDAAEHFEVSASSAIWWMQRYEETGSWQAKPVGGSVSPLEEHAAVLLAIVEEMPDITLDENGRGHSRAQDRRQPHCHLVIFCTPRGDVTDGNQPPIANIWQQF